MAFSRPLSALVLVFGLVLLANAQPANNCAYQFKNPDPYFYLPSILSGDVTLNSGNPIVLAGGKALNAGQGCNGQQTEYWNGTAWTSKWKDLFGNNQNSISNFYATNQDKLVIRTLQVSQSTLEDYLEGNHVRTWITCNNGLYGCVQYGVQRKRVTDLQLSPNTVNEGQPAGTVVGTFIPTGPVNEAYTYSFWDGVFTGRDNNKFSISGNVLKTRTVLEDRTYSINVLVTVPSRGLTFTKILTVTGLPNRCAGVVCAALDQCHVAGVCDPTTGTCSNPLAADGQTCDDGNACTQSDSCQAGSCLGSNPVTCTAADECHIPGTCDTATGECSVVNAADGTECHDDNACTQTDTCQSGVCVGSNGVVCPAADQCHEVGECDVTSGECVYAPLEDGTGCDDQNPCSLADSCQAGACVGASQVECPASTNPCHSENVCSPDSGECETTLLAQGTPCSDGDACTSGDQCNAAGTCVGSPRSAPYPSHICASNIQDAICNVTLKSAYSSVRFGIHANAYYQQPFPRDPIIQELFSSRATEYFTPASNTKLFTAAATLARYDENEVFETLVKGDLPVPPQQESWTQLTPTGTGPTGRLYAKGVYTNNRFYIWAGQAADSGRPVAVAYYTPATNAWTVQAVGANAPAGRLGHAQVLSQDGTKFYIFSGSAAAGRLNDIAEYTIATNSWTTFDTTGQVKPDVRSLPCGVSINNGTKLLFFGGSQGTAKFFNDLWTFDLATRQWSQIAASGPIPVGRSGSSCVMDGNTMIVFGGHISGTTKVNEILKFDTVSNTWLVNPTPAGTLPTVRTTHAAVLTSDRVMIVFGGTSGTNLNSIAKYDVESNTWLTTAPTGSAPSVRDSPVGVYVPATNQVLIWGGQGTSYFTDMYSYQYVPTVTAAPVTSQLCVVASGDPTLTLTQIRSIASNLAAAGVSRVENLVIDGSVYSGEYEPSPFWDLDLLPTTNAPAPGPFVVDRNAVSFTISAASAAGQPAVISWPNSVDVGTVSIINEIETVASGSTVISLSYPNTSEGILLTGRIAVGAASVTRSSVSVYPSVPRFAALMKNVLNQAGIAVDAVEQTVCPSDLPTVYTIKSPNMKTLVQQMLSNSDNLYAEALLRRLGVDDVVNRAALAGGDSFAVDTVASGVSEVNRLLSTAYNGVDVADWHQIDGSGLASNNQVSPVAVVSLLQSVWRSSNGTTLREGLPVAGVSGTLSTRFPVGDPANGVLYAKTGTLDGASALSGYIKPCADIPIHFSILANAKPGYNPSTNTLRAGIDEIANIFASWDSKC
jgi:PBP4 family serine-type D-alanyl-D-alanine carboxypeptidase